MLAIMHIQATKHVGNIPFGTPTTLEARSSTKVGEVKKLLEQEEGTPVTNQRIFFHGQHLSDELSLGYVSREEASPTRKADTLRSTIFASTAISSY